MVKRSARMVLVLGVLGILATSCLAPTGSPTRAGNWDFPDPAAESLPGGVQLYGTNTRYPFDPTRCYKVPTMSTAYPNVSAFGLKDALPTLPAGWWSNAGGCTGTSFIWAPTVRFVGGRYLMMFTASRSGASACIGAATSNSVVGPFTVVPTFKLCDSQSNVGMLDPQLYREGSDTWLLWSRQWRSGSGGSEIVTQKLTANGLGLVGTRPYRLLTFDQANQASPAANGPNSYVENPALVKDPYNGYDLIVSIGDWKDGSYRTVEVPCLTVTGNCLPGEGDSISGLMGGTSVSSKGGGSLMYDFSPDGNILAFHGRPTGVGERYPYVQKTGSVNLNPKDTVAAQSEAPPTLYAAAVAAPAYVAPQDRAGVVVAGTAGAAAAKAAAGL